MGAFLTNIARALMERERQKLGIPQQEQAAAAAESSNLLRQAQAARALQELGTGPEDRALRTRLVEAQIRNYDEPNRIAAQVKPPAVGSFEDYVVAKYGPRPTPEQIAEGRKVYQQADDRPRVGGTAVSLQLPMPVYDTQTKQMTYATKAEVVAGGGRYVPPPTVAQRNVEAGTTAGQVALRQAQQRANPVLQDLGTRITSINRGSEGGFLARAGGAVRRTAGSIGADPAADLYTSGVRGFVPLFARSVGHVGVLTELDVKRTEDLFPRIGDSAVVTQEKLARLQRITTGQEPMPFQFEHPEYTEGGITVPGSQASGAPPSSGVSPNVQRILDMIKARNAGQ